MELLFQLSEEGKPQSVGSVASYGLIATTPTTNATAAVGFQAHHLLRLFLRIY
jgi:hypothetical protein